MLTDATFTPYGGVEGPQIEKRDRIPWPDPTPEMMADPRFDAIWDVVKTWDVNVQGAYLGYCGANGNHVRAILDALDKVQIPPTIERSIDRLTISQYVLMILLILHAFIVKDFIK